MAAHTTTGRWQLGLGLALSVVVFWATLPVMLKLGLGQLDAITFTWVRFASAFLATALIQIPRHGLAPYRRLDARGRWMLLAASGSLVLNYVLYIGGLDRTTPGNAQVLIQLAPVCMTLGGLLIFGERYNKKQWAGFATLLLGLALFSGGRLEAVADPRYSLGSAMVVLAAVAWGTYALFQKALLARLTAQQVMLAVYACGAVVLLPFSAPSRILSLDTPGLIAVGYAAVNSLGAYGAFAESLRHWEASRISTVLAVTPLGTLATVALAHHFYPDLFAPEPMTALAWAGAILVVVGSAVSSLAHTRVKPPRI